MFFSVRLEYRKGVMSFSSPKSLSSNPLALPPDLPGLPRREEWETAFRAAEAKYGPCILFLHKIPLALNMYEVRRKKENKKEPWSSSVPFNSIYIALYIHPNISSATGGFSDACEDSARDQALSPLFPSRVAYRYTTCTPFSFLQSPRMH